MLVHIFFALRRVGAFSHIVCKTAQEAGKEDIYGNIPET